MLFNSLEFLVFFLIFFSLYWGVFKKSLRFQNILLLVGSYTFYGWWDYRFLILILLSTVVDFFSAKLICSSKETNFKKKILAFSILFNLSILFFFKYYNFFIDTFFEVFNIDSFDSSFSLLNIILPVGISFYTFQTMSYTIDVYNNKLKPTNDIISFAVFVSFFPQLVAGPIERATKFLPQIISKRTFNYHIANAGLYLILIGFFKKLVIADGIAPSVDSIFSNFERLNYINLFIGSLLFSFQIYCDFSGYTDIARGISKLLGFELRLNFNFPYFASSISDFWRRWHISLSTWFRDYLYIPLGGSRLSFNRTLINIFIVFVVSGLWHGANLTFVFWGFIHALMFIPSFIIRKYYNAKKLFIHPVIKSLFIFLTVNFAWIFFRSDTINNALLYCKKIFFFDDGLNYLSLSAMGAGSLSNLIVSVFFILCLMIYEILEYNKRSLKPNISFIVSIIIIILLFGQFSDEKSFIYFQF